MGRQTKKMRGSELAFAAFFSAAGLMAGCSGNAPAGGTTILSPLTGRVSAGPVDGAVVSLYTLDASGNRGALIASAVTSSTGDFTVPQLAYSGPVMLVASGGRYSEEAAGSSVTLSEMKATFNTVAGGGKAAVTPLTHIAAERAIEQASAGAASITTAISDANTAVATAAGLTGEITQFLPANPSVDLASQGLSATSSEAKYAMVLAGLSQLAVDSGSNSVKLMQALARDFKADGSFNGTDNGTAISGVTSTTWGTDLAAKQTKFAANNPNAPIATVTPTIPVTTPITVANGPYFVLVNDSTTGALSSYAMASNGTMSFVNSVTANAGGRHIVAARSGRCVYVSNGGAYVDIFSVAPTTGGVSYIGKSSTSIGITAAGAMAVNNQYQNTNHILYVANNNGNTSGIPGTVTSLAIASDCSLSFKSNVTLSATVGGVLPTGLAVSGDDACLVTASSGSGVGGGIIAVQVTTTGAATTIASSNASVKISGAADHAAGVMITGVSGSGSKNWIHAVDSFTGKFNSYGGFESAASAGTPSCQFVSGGSGVQSVALGTSGYATGMDYLASNASGTLLVSGNGVGGTALMSAAVDYTTNSPATIKRTGGSFSQVGGVSFAPDANLVVAVDISARKLISFSVNSSTGLFTELYSVPTSGTGMLSPKAVKVIRPQ